MYFHSAGRLGNQLFQYAFAHQLSIHFDRQVTFFFDKYHLGNKYEWDVSEHLQHCRHISGKVRSDYRGLMLKTSDKMYLTSRQGFEILSRSAKFMRVMDAFEYPKFPKDPPKLITGFYLNSLSIERSPVFLEELGDYLSKNVNVDKFIINNDYEILHIRGTDMKNSIYGTLNHNYYLNIPKSNLPRYIITDDPSHARFLTKDLEVAGIFSPKELNPWESLQLMRYCKRVYASNSTLAWWGSYLSLKNGGEAILPKPFYPQNFTASTSLHVEGFNYREATFD